MFAYEARRLLRDRLVGSKHQEMFDSLLATILREEWSFDCGFLAKGDGVYFTTFGVSSGTPHTKSTQGHPLGRLSGTDLNETLSKTMKQYSERTTRIVHYRAMRPAAQEFRLLEVAYHQSVMHQYVSYVMKAEC